MDQESIVLDVDPRSVLAAIKQANAAVEGWEGHVVGSGDKMQKALERMGEMLLKVNDRSRNSMERLTQSIEKQAAAYGKTGVERLVAERDRLIKKLGDEQGMVDRVTAAYAKMIAAEEKNAHGAQNLGNQVKEFIERPMAASGEAVSGLLGKLGPLGTGLAAGGAALVAAGAAAWEAAKNLGEYGTRIHDVEIRTGLNTKQAQEYALAAKMVGQDVSVVERAMRGLTQAVEGDSKESEKARDVLRRWGIDLQGVRAGTVSTAEVLEQVSAGLGGTASNWQRNIDLLTVFKRAGIELGPFLMELNENMERASKVNFASDEEIKRFRDYQKEVSVIEEQWHQVKLRIEEAIVSAATFALGGKKDPDASVRYLSETDEQAAERLREGIVGQGLRNLGRTNAGIARSQATEAMRLPIQSQADHLREMYFGGHDALERAYQAAKKDVEKYQDELAGAGRAGLSMAEVQTLGGKLAGAAGREQAAKAALDAEAERKKLIAEAAAFEKKGDEAELDAIGKIYHQRDLLLKQAEHMKGVEGEIVKIRQAADAQASAIQAKRLKEIDEYFASGAYKPQPSRPASWPA